MLPSCRLSHSPGTFSILNLITVKRLGLFQLGLMYPMYPHLLQKKQLFQHWKLYLVGGFPIFSHDFLIGSPLSSHSKMVDSLYFPIDSPFTYGFPWIFPWIFPSNLGGKDLDRVPASIGGGGYGHGERFFFGGNHEKWWLKWLNHLFFDGHIGISWKMNEHDDFPLEILT